ncbi:hypothetical protein PMAC_001446 [Pneumocystis sp. 'macacae']|nr:hypothetical protein PMAC_001446 [Pneumocystis sp. 'macacae']
MLRMSVEKPAMSCETCLMSKKHGWCPLSGICVYAPKGLFEPFYNKSICLYSSDIQERWEFRGAMFGCQSNISLLPFSTATFLLAVALSVFVLIFSLFMICLFRFFKGTRKNNECNDSQQPLLPSYKRLSYYNQPQASPFDSFGSSYRTLPLCRGSSYYGKQMLCGNTAPTDCKKKSSWGKQRSLLLTKPTDTC